MKLRIILAFVAVAAIAGCGESSTADGVAADDRRVTVVATTTMIADLAKRIAGDDATVVGLMKPGEDPHTYEVRPRDAQAIAEADVVLMNGLQLEATLDRIAQNNTRPGALLVRLAEHPDIQPLGKLDDAGQVTGAPDPHCWFDVAYFRIYAQGVRDALIRADPDHAEGYGARTAEYLAQLDELDVWVRQQLETVPRERRVLVTSHDAFGYYGRAYGVDVFAVIGMSTEQQPRPRDVEELERQVRERGVRALFIETSVSSTLNDLVRKVADATGARVGGTLYSDSLGDADSPAATYLDMIRHNTTTIVEALR